MKKITLFLLFTLVVSFSSFSQIAVEDLIDNASSMVQKGDNQDMSRALDLVTMGLKSTAGQGDGIFKDKLISQIGSLGAITTALKGGVADKTALQKTLGVLKTLIAAQGLSSLLKSGNLLGKAAKVASAIGIIKGGLALLGTGKKVDDVASLLDKVSGKTEKLDKKGLFAKLAQNALKKKLGSALGMVNGLI
jgi:hypothetical protein